MALEHTDTAGSGPPDPAVSSVRAGGHDIVPEDARRELDRIRLRWGQLPLDRAEEAAPAVREVVEAVAARTADDEVPDLGPAVVVDQLAVVTWDACAAGRGGDLAEVLADLRRSLP